MSCAVLRLYSTWQPLASTGASFSLHGVHLRLVIQKSHLNFDIFCVVLGGPVAHSARHRIRDQYVTGSSLSRVPRNNLGQVI